MNEPPHFFFIVIFYNIKFRTRAILSTIVKNLAFTISKHYFYNFNTSFYNIPDIKTSIFLQLHLNIISFIIFYSFFVFIFFILSLWSHCLSLSLSVSLSLPLSFLVSLSQPSNQTHRRPLATIILTTTTTIKDPQIGRAHV